MKSVIKAVIAVVVLASAAGAAGLMDSVKGQTAAVTLGAVAAVPTEEIATYTDYASSKQEAEQMMARTLAALKEKGVKTVSSRYSPSKNGMYIKVGYVKVPGGYYIGLYDYNDKSEISAMRKLGLDVFNVAAPSICKQAAYMANDAKGEVVRISSEDMMTALAAKLWVAGRVAYLKAHGCTVLRASYEEFTEASIVKQIEIAYVPLAR